MSLTYRKGKADPGLSRSGSSLSSLPKTFTTTAFREQLTVTNNKSEDPFAVLKTGAGLLLI